MSEDVPVFFLLNFQLLMYSIGQVFAHSGESVQKNTNQVQADVGSEHMYRIVATEKKALLRFSFNHNAMKLIQM